MPLLPTKLQEIRDETTRLAREAGPDMEEDGQRGALVPLRAPAAPTRDEVQEHEARKHANCRTWFRASTAGRGRADAHAGTSRDEHALPTVDVDYAYMGDKSKTQREDECRREPERNSEQVVREEIGCGVDDGAMAPFHTEIRPEFLSLETAAARVAHGVAGCDRFCSTCCFDDVEDSSWPHSVRAQERQTLTQDVTAVRREGDVLES